MQVQTQSFQHSWEFTNLPSDRSPPSPAAQELGRLAVRAVGLGEALAMKDSRWQERRREELRRYNGADFKLDYKTRPGAMIEEQTSEIRAALSQLTSDDLRSIDRKMPKFWAGWWLAGETTPRHTGVHRRRSARWM